MHRLPLIINTTAKGSNARKILSWVSRNLKDFVVYGTDDVRDAKKVARKLAESGAERVVVAGGDGTINFAIQGLHGTGTELGILPAGTMNVFARELKIPLGNLDKSYAAVKSGQTRKVNLFLANGKPFLQMAGVGFDAQVIQSTSWEMKKAFGPMAYVVQACRLIGRKQPLLRIEYADGTVDEGVCALIGNGALYGGKFKLFPEADNADGLLDVLVFKRDRLELMRDTLRALSPGMLQKLPTAVRQTPALRVTSDEPVPLELDGDYAGTTPIEFSLAAKPLLVRTP